MEFYKFSLIYYIILVKITILTATYDASDYMCISKGFKCIPDTCWQKSQATVWVFGCNTSSSYKVCPGYCLDCYDNGNCSGCGKAYYSLSNKPCVSCSSECSKCSSSGCLECTEENYYPVGPDCEECLPKCKTCVNDYECTECKGFQRQNIPPSCPCNSGWWDNGSSPHCQSCLAICSKCDDDSGCTKCKGLGKINILCDACDTSKGYYDKIEFDCGQCASGCQLCDNDITCQSCFSEGYYLDSGDICQPCSPKCLDCSGDPEQCGNCKGANRNNDPPNCTCQDPYYHDPAQEDCKPCDSKCSKCTTGGSCTDCLGANRIPPDCVCDIGFYDNVGDCGPCDSNCYKCTGTPDFCTTCISTNNRSSEPTCKCNDGYFDFSDECEKCDDSVCATCLGTDVSCIIPCNDGCSNCDISGKCTGTTCITGYVFNSSTGDCDKCDNKCQNCESDLVTCKGGCLDTTRDFGNNCACNPGLYSTVLSGTCDKNCDYKYGTCEEVTGIMISCSDSNRDDANDCKCIEEYHEDGINNPICKKCQFPCVKCLSANVCETCVGENRIVTSCQCKTGYLEKGTSCEKCSDTCLSCEDNVDKCISCHPDSTRDMNDPQCKCLEDYYIEDENKFKNMPCKPCPPECSTCHSNGQCQKCLNGDLIPPYCLFAVQSGVLSKEVLGKMNLFQITKCNPKCLICYNKPSNCTKCQNGLNRMIQEPDCLCMNGYHDDNGNLKDCLPCQQGCLQCENHNKCLQCDTNRNLVLNLFQNKCECARGFKLNKYHVCVQCMYYKNQCVEKCPKNTEVSMDNSRICIQMTEQMQQNSSLIYVSAFMILLLLTILILFQIRNVFKKQSNNNYISKRIQKKSIKK